MSKTREQIVRDLLRLANYYWYDDHDDRINPINVDDYDPIVDKIFKANAVEIEKLHDEIAESREEIILGLAKSLVPNQSLLPEPGYTVAQIHPAVSRVETNIYDQFMISGQSDTGEKFEYYFSPLFPHNYPGCELVAVLSSHIAIKIENGAAAEVKESPGVMSTSSFWLGLKLSEVKERDQVSFYLGNQIVDGFDKDFSILQNARWLLNGQVELQCTRGISAFNGGSKGSGILETLEIPKNHEQQIFTRFRDSFIHLKLPKNINSEARLLPPDPQVESFVEELALDQPLCWIKLECALPVAQKFLLENPLYPNCIPLVNRRIKENYVFKTDFERTILPLRTEDLFLDIHAVRDTNDWDDKSGYERVDFLRPDSRPGTYMLRGGSRVRRMSRQDASQQINRLLEVIQEEYSTFKEEGVNRLREDFDIIEKGMNRIKEHLPHYFRDQDEKSAFFCLAHFRKGVSRLHYYYWETQGPLIRHLGNKIGLEVSSTDVHIGECQSIIPIQSGKGELSSDDYLNQLRISLLSRGKITTKADIEWYCESRFGKVISLLHINRRLMVLKQGGVGRGIVATITPKVPMNSEELEIIRTELQNDLNAKTAIFTDIKVEIDGNQ